MKKEPKIVVQKIDDLSQLRHGDRVVIVENGKKLVEGKLVGRPWASKHVQVGPGRQPRSTIAKAQESVIVNDMITLGSAALDGAHPRKLRTIRSWIHLGKLLFIELSSNSPRKES